MSATGAVTCARPGTAAPRRHSAHPGQLRQHGLRKGDQIEGTAAPPEHAAVPGTTGTQGIPGFSASLPSTGDRLTRRNYAPHFENLTPVYPSERLRLEAGDASPTARHLMMVLVGERPAEGTDLRRSARGG